MRRLVLTIGAALAVGLVLVPSLNSAIAATVRVGPLVLRGDGVYWPHALPKHHFAPISFKGQADISMTTGEKPPALQHGKVEFDRDGHISTKGLSTCSPSQVENVGADLARKRCQDAIVGLGHAGATVTVPLLGEVELLGPLTLFNGPKQRGNLTVVAHAQAPFPVSETYMVVVPIERRPGIFGYRASFDVPPILGGLGSLTHIDLKIDRRFRVGGKEHSYVSARCSDYILQAQGYFSFADGTIIYGSVFKTCRPL